MAVAIPSKVSKVVDIFVSIAAAGVIWGALQKILHTPSADLWLKIGLGTEALVFLVYGILYIIYPAVQDHHGADAHAKPAPQPQGEQGRPLVRPAHAKVGDDSPRGRGDERHAPVLAVGSAPSSGTTRRSILVPRTLM